MIMYSIAMMSSSLMIFLLLFPHQEFVKASPRGASSSSLSENNDEPISVKQHGGETLFLRQLMGQKPDSGGDDSGSGSGSCASAGQVALDCDPDAKGKKEQSCCPGLTCKNNWCNYALEGVAAGECDGGPTYPTNCAPGLECDLNGLCATPTDDDCTAWCQQIEILGWYEQDFLETHVASSSNPDCSSDWNSGECTCTLSAIIAVTHTLANTNNVDAICDAHHLLPDCGPGGVSDCQALCDTELGRITISGRLESDGECTCVAATEFGGVTKDVFSSTCSDNQYLTGGDGGYEWPTIFPTIFV